VSETGGQISDETPFVVARSEVEARQQISQLVQMSRLSKIQMCWIPGFLLVMAFFHAGLA